MSICCVLGCDVQDSDDTTYFTFPIKPALRKKWRAAIPTTNKLHDDSKVCAHHFRSTDYEWVRGKMRLKSGVVPCIFGWDETLNEPKASPEAAQAVNTVNCEPVTSLEPVMSLEPVALTEPAVLPESPVLPEPVAFPEPVVLPEPVMSLEPAVLSEPVVLPEPVIPDPEPLPEAPDFMAIGGYECLQREDESAENCTIECVPEAILNQESDSDSETELHKEDIENIIANYHIKPNKELAERLKASEALDREKQKEYLLTKNNSCETNTQNGEISLPNGVFSAEIPISGGKSTDNGGKSAKKGGKYFGSGGNSSRSGGRSSGRAARRSRNRSASSEDSDCILTEEPEPQFIEISVDGGKDTGDCMMLLESVQVDVDPSTLLQNYHPLISDEPSKAEAISLLTSSDSDDVILQEPHIDTVEVSSSDSESQPLVRLVGDNTRRLYPCYQCRFTTHSKSQYQKHRLTHSPHSLVCYCGEELESKAAMRRHERTHRKFECHLCDFRARQSSALVYHMKSHALQRVHMGDACMMLQDVKKSKTRKKLKRKKRYKCGDCSFAATHRRDLEAHRAELH